jgi:hypothetical protein
MIMANTNNETETAETTKKPETLAVPFTRGADGCIDLDAFMVAAEEAGVAFQVADKAETEAVVEVVNKIVSDKRHEKVTNFTASTLAKMALGLLGEIPTDARCAQTEPRVRAYLLGQSDKFLHIARGRNSGFHLISRYSKEDYEKLTKNLNK